MLRTKIRTTILAILAIPALAFGQGSLPIAIQQLQGIARPAIDASASTVSFGSTVAANGSRSQAMNVFVAGAAGSAPRALTKFDEKTQVRLNPNSVAIQSDGKRAAYAVAGSTASPLIAGPSEEVHVFDLATGADRAIAVDTGGCLLPLAAVCFGCFVSCVNEPHFSGDGSKILFSVRRNNPLTIANADGTGVAKLPVYTGAIASSSQRVVSRNGLIAFTSSAPFGPTFAAAATDVYLINLDGSNIRNISSSGTNPSILSANATISADGSAVAYERYDLSGPPSSAVSPQIWIARTDGTGATALTQGDVPSSQPTISGDGSVVAFVRSGQIVVSTRRIGIATSERIVTKFQSSVAQSPVISEDGARIVFALGPGDGSIGALYSMNADGTGLRPIFAPRSANPSGVVGMNFSFPSPGSLFSLYGLNLAPDGIASASGFPLPNALAGASLFVNDVPVPMLSATPWQLNAQMPMEAAPGPAVFTLRFSDGTQNVANAEIKGLSPGIFLVPDKPSPPGGGGISVFVPQIAAAIHSQTSRLVTSENPALAGEVIEVYGTGLGRTTPMVAAGQPSPVPPAKTNEDLQVEIGGARAQVLFSGLAPGLAGVYQVNCIVPSGLRPGFQTMTWKFDANTAGFATIPIR